MFNFDFKNPTKLIFGRDTIQRISQEIPHGSKVLLLYGAGSIKQNGVYDEVVNALSGFSYIEFGLFHRIRNTMCFAKLYRSLSLKK